MLHCSKQSVINDLAHLEDIHVVEFGATSGVATATFGVVMLLVAVLSKSAIAYNPLNQLKIWEVLKRGIWRNAGYWAQKSPLDGGLGDGKLSYSGFRGIVVACERLAKHLNCPCLLCSFDGRLELFTRYPFLA